MVSALLDPRRLWSREDVLTTVRVPRASGVYAWYFKAPPALVPLDCREAKMALSRLHRSVQ